VLKAAVLLPGKVARRAAKKAIVLSANRKVE
jgi:hypothetical protein